MYNHGECHKVGLGTAQFGSHYGISNITGQPTEKEIRDILDYAVLSGVCHFDTAPRYGESEQLLGDLLSLPDVKITTKIENIYGDEIVDHGIEEVKNGFYESLENLGRDKIYGVLLHDADDLLKEGSSNLFMTLESFKEHELIEKHGVSIYTVDQLVAITKRYPVDVVQIPVSIYDQRFISGGLAYDIKEKYGLEIHARSVFLQGLLLMEPSMIPKRLSKVKDHQICVQNLVQSEGRSMLDVAISYVESLEEIDSVVYGVTALSELKKILEVERLDVPRDITRQAELKNTEILDPRKW